MTPQERQLVDDLFDRLAKVESAPRDPDAANAIQDGLRRAPNATYALVQTVLLQDEALKRASARIDELEHTRAPEQKQSGGFLDSMRDNIFGKDSSSRGSVPNVPPPAPSRPVWNSGQVLEQGQAGGQNDQRYGQGPYGQGGYGQAGGYGQSASPFGGGGSFLGTAAAAAAGMVGGSLLLNGVRGMMGGGHHQAFGDTASLGQRSESPWGGDQSNSSLAHDAGIEDVGRSDSGSHTGLFDQASIDRQQDADQDAMDMDSDDFGSDDDNGSDDV